MLAVRAADQIHRTEGGWFSARWHFSFDDYHDPEQMGFGPLRVFNDDRLVPGAVWPLHPHRDIEGITWVVEGTFEHEDSLGNGGTLLPGSLQRATLGSGMYHSERNGSKTEPMRFLQFWILPDTAGLPPSVDQKTFPAGDRTDRLLRVAGPSADDPVKIHQDASVHVGLLSARAEVRIRLGRDAARTSTGSAAGEHSTTRRRARVRRLVHGPRRRSASPRRSRPRSSWSTSRSNGRRWVYGPAASEALASAT